MLLVMCYTNFGTSGATKYIHISYFVSMFHGKFGKPYIYWNDHPVVHNEGCGSSSEPLASCCHLTLRYAQWRSSPGYGRVFSNSLKCQAHAVCRTVGIGQCTSSSTKEIEGRYPVVRQPLI